MQALRTVLELLASGAPLEEVLRGLVLSIESSHPQLIASVLLLDESGRRLRHSAAPSLPDFYNDAVDGLEIGPHVASCGAAAARAERVVVRDVREHPDWADYVPLADRAGVRACWSQPILSSQGKVLGTFALYYREPREPGDEELALIESAAHLCGVAIEKYRADEELRRTLIELENRVSRRTQELEEAIQQLRDQVRERNAAESKLEEERNLLQTIIDLLPARIFVKDAECRYVVNNRSHLDFLGVAAPEEARGKTTTHFFPTELGHRSLEEDRKVLDEARPLLNREVLDQDPSGNDRWVLTSKIPFRGVQGEIQGLVGISHDITDQKLKESRLAALSEQLRAQNEQMETDLRMARDIQQACLPQKYPSFPSHVSPGESSLQFCHRYRPTRTLAGDFFDIISISEKKAGALICDVMGHGLRASLVTALLRGLVEQLLPVAGSPSVLLQEINRSLLAVLQPTGPVFVTAFYAVADLEQNQILYSNAGHPNPLFVHRDARTVEPLGAESDKAEPALGIMPFEYTTRRRPLALHDRLVLFTDGVFQESGPSGERFTRDQLLAAVLQQAELPLPQFLDRLLAEIQEVSGTEEFSDDVCLVAVEVSTAG